jgi:hypothetical protein
MSGILNSGKIATILDRLTSVRAGYLDNLTNLDAALSTLLSTGGYTSTRAAKLDNLDAAVSTLGNVAPIASGIVGVPTARTDFSTAATYVGAATTDSSTNTGTWENIISVTTTEGILQFAGVYQVANSASKNVQCRLTIDGNTVYTSATNLWSASSQNDRGVAIIGTYAEGSFAAGIAFDRVPFTTGFTIDWKKTSAGVDTVEMGAICRYYKTG